jgi:hypothetical protein
MKDKLTLLQLIPTFDSNPKILKGLSKDEVKYWKDSLQRNIRVAAEFELNLPEDDGNYCMLSNKAYETCICYKAVTGECEAICKNESCEFKGTDSCNEPDCMRFVSSCLGCTSYKQSCDKCRKDYKSKTENPSTCREKIMNELKPRNDVLSPRGVHQVTTDGSLIGGHGVEVTTIAQFPDYNILYDDYKTILDTSLNNFAWINERCSTHIHMMTQYIPNGGKARKEDNSEAYFSSLEKPIPEEIISNFHQLLRRFEHVLLWISSTGNSLGHLTRWEKFRQPIMPIASPLTSGMEKVNQSISKYCRDKVKKDKYSTVNYFYSRFDEDSNMRIFHIEARFPDASFCPSVPASIACLLFAMLLKAIDISHYGILTIGSNDVITRINTMRSLLVNNNGGYELMRVSKTGGVLKYIDQFTEDSIELVKFLESYLTRMGDSYHVLYELATRPISLRRAIDKLSWEQINEQLDPKMKNKPKEKPAMSIEEEILSIIDLGHISESSSKEDWANILMGELNVDQVEIKGCLAKLQEMDHIVWSNNTKTYIRK